MPRIQITKKFLTWSLFAVGLVCCLTFATVLPRIRMSETVRPILVQCSDTNDIDCVQSVVRKTILSGGMKQGFQLLNDWYRYQPSFRPACFPTALWLGGEIANIPPPSDLLSFTPITTVCNYGFYQEYPRRMLLKTKDIPSMQSFCMRVGDVLDTIVPDARAECFRGIGRALPYFNIEDIGNLKKMATFALDTCARISPNAKAHSFCAAGAFNQLGRDLASGKLLGGSTDPLIFCDAQPDAIRAYCYGNFKWALFANITAGEDILDIFLSHTHVAKTTVLRSLDQIAYTRGYQDGHAHVAFPDQFEPLLSAARVVPPIILNNYIAGVALGIAKNGTPHQQGSSVLAFCTATQKYFPSVPATVCVGDALLYLRGFYTPGASVILCNDFKTHLGVACP